jgi:integrase
LLDSNNVRDWLYRMTPPDASASDRKAGVDEMLVRLENAVKPATAKVKVITKQDRVDSEHTRLTRAQAGALMAAPRQRADNTPIQALRDTAMIALTLCTGLREMELVGLNVDDLRQRSNGELVLLVREGKGAKQRVIPYGHLEWCLSIVDSWMLAAGIERGPVFRGFYRNGKTVRPTRLTVRAINQTLDKYPVMVDGVLTTVKPHDLRRTYARRMYEENTPPVVIQQNLGHSDLKTTLGYIGDLSIEQRKPPAIYDQPDLSSFRTLLDETA